MPSPVFLSERSGSHIYRVGRVGYDSGDQDTGGAYTGTLKSEKQSPLGPQGLCHFRRIGIRIRHTGAFTMTLTVYVDGQQTQIYDSSSVLVDQTISFTEAAPTGENPTEVLLEGDISARGTYIQLKLTVTSTDVVGVFLPESFDVFYRPLREAKVGAAESQ